jgi:Family of unknown function (DUF5686)/CarboxypepD_reg-like domain
MYFRNRRIAFRILLIGIFSLYSLRAWAQTTRLSGKVYNTSTSEGMPYVSIVALGTTQGTVSDMDGNYSLVINGKVDSIRAVYVGYFPTTLPVKTGTTQVLNIPMKENTIQLHEVTIIPGENPAVTILKQVWKHKPENDKENLDSYQYEAYNKLEFDLNNIPEKMQKSRVMKPVKFIFDNIDTTNPSEKPHLPLFFSESVSDFYYRKDPKTKKEIIKGSKVSGVQDASIAQFTGDMYQNVDIYENNIVIFGKTFASPISTNGQAYYRYYLIDSMTIDGRWCYQIQFKPKRKQELLFIGNVWIADTAFAVKRIEMNIVEDANINYVNAFFVIQEYDNSSGAWMRTKERVIAEFVLQEKQTGFYGRKTTSYKNIVVNKPMPDDFYSKTDNLIVEQGAEKRDDSFWETARHDTLSKQEQGIYNMVDSVQNLKIYRSWENIILTAYTGYKVFGPIEYGPWYKTVSYNQIEGVRLRVGGRTSNNFSRRVEMSGYAAYGLKDEQFKYNFAFKTLISKKPRQLAGANYKNDLEILGLSNNAFTSDNVLATIFRRSPLTNFTHVEHYEIWFERDLFLGLNTRLAFVKRNMNPINGLGYMQYTDANHYQNTPGVSMSEMRLNVRFAWDEKYVESVFSRVSVGTKFPILQLLYVAGFKGVLGSDYAYHKLSLNLDDRIRFGPFGYLNYILEAGKTWGITPFPLMVMHPGNQTYVYDWSAYNMMNYFEFTSDQYAQATFIYHLDGLFLNHIPLMRKLKWREVASFKWLVGTVSEENRRELIFPNTLYSLNRGPYMEAGVGIENIFRFFRVDGFWRLSYLDHPNANPNANRATVSPFGIRFSLQILF